MNKLSRMLSKRLSETNMSVRRAGLQIGVSHATVARAVNGETVEVDTLVRIADFLRVSIISLIDETAKSFTRFWGKWYIIFRDVEFRAYIHEQTRYGFKAIETVVRIIAKIKRQGVRTI